MRTQDLGCLVVVLGLGLSACAGTPAAVEDASAGPAAQAAVVQAPEAGARPPAALGESQPATGNAGAPPGWRVVKRNGETLWCSLNPPTGTRLGGKAVCMTPEEHEAAQQGGQDWLGKIQRETILNPQGG
jgi:hypothetical protein